MTPSNRSKHIFKFELLATLGASAVALICAAVIIGWTFGIPSLRRIDQLPEMQINSAIPLLMGAISLLLLRKKEARSRRARVGRILAAIVVLIGGAFLLETITGLNLGIDQLIVQVPQASQDPTTRPFPGRPSPQSALAFVIIGTALLVLDFTTRRGRYPAQFLAILATIIGGVAIGGYLFGASQLYGFGVLLPFVGMSLHTATGLFLLSFAILFSRPEHGPMTLLISESAGGAVARRFLSLAFGLPILNLIVLSFCRYIAVALEALVVALFTLFVLLLVFAIVWWTSRSLERSENKLRAQMNRAELLADLGKKFVRSNTLSDACALLSDFLLPRFADWLYIAILDQYNRPRLIWVKHSDPNKQELARQLEDCVPNPDVPSGMIEAMREKKPVIHHDVTPEMLQANGREWPLFAPRDPEHLNIVRALGVRSYMAFPLVMRDRPIGALVVLSGNPARAKATDTDLVIEIVRQASMGIDNALLFEDIQKDVRIREEFISIASHELKTPLTSLKLKVDLLARGARKQVSHQAPGTERAVQVEPLIEGAMRDINRFSRLIEMLLDVSRIGAGKLSLERTEVNFSTLVKDIVERMRADFENAKTELRLDITPDIWGQWDSVRIEQIVNNLLSNAIRYAPGAPIEIKLSQSDTQALLSVRDHGPGIPKEDQERIFLRFERAGTRRSFGGLGLGLYITRELVQAHGGHIWLESEPGKGAAFFVTLPKRIIKVLEPSAA